MNINIVKNKYFNALFLLMLFSAIVHMLILFYSAITWHDWYMLNYFNILDVDLWIPNIGNTIIDDFLSLIFAGIIYVVILKINNRPRNNE